MQLVETLGIRADTGLCNAIMSAHDKVWDVCIYIYTFIICNNVSARAGTGLGHAVVSAHDKVGPCIKHVGYKIKYA